MTNFRIFAAGDVELDAHSSGSFLIVSGGNVKLGPMMLLDTSIVIAKGAVRIGGGVDRSSVVAGKSVTYNRVFPNSLTLENESDPLGYFRWSDPSKDKAAPKAK